MTHIADKQSDFVLPGLPAAAAPKASDAPQVVTEKKAALGFGDSFEVSSPLLRFGQLPEANLPRDRSAVWELNPDSAFFDSNMARKYETQTFDAWQAIANVLSAYMAQMMASIMQQMLNVGPDSGNSDTISGVSGGGGGGGTIVPGTPKPPPSPPPEVIPDTTPSAIHGYTPRTLVNKELFDQNGPSADDIQQGGLGDCYFLSALGGVASEDPDVIRNNIREHVDPATGEVVPGEYDVRFYEKNAEGETVEKWVTVNDSMLRDQRGNEAYAQTTDNDKDGKWEQWVAIYEKGYAVFNSQRGDVDQGYDEIGEGGWGGEAYFAITGRDASADNPTQMNDQELLDILNRTNPADGDVVMLGSIGGGNDSQLRADGLPASHMYQVLGTYQDSNTGETMVTIRNPWGSFEPGVIPDGRGGFTYTDEFDGTNDGIFSIPLSQVHRDFDLITYADDPTYDMTPVRYPEIRS